MARKQGRSEVEKAIHRRQIAVLYLEQKLTQVEIGKILKLSQSTVSRDIEAIIAREQQDTRPVVEKWRERVTARLSMIEHEAEAAWERSKHITITPKGVLTARRDEEFPGDSTHLREMRGAVMDLAKVQGVFKIEDEGEKPPTTINIHVNPVPARVSPE